MRVFITGGTGLIGSSVVAELLNNGHSVSALARSDSSASVLKGAGAEPLLGSLSDLEVLREGAGGADGVINLAFNNDFTNPNGFAKGVTEESAALAAMGSVLIGSNKPFITVAGTPATVGRPSIETDPLPTEGPTGGRSLSVGTVLALASQGVRSAAVRLPRTVHNKGKGGFAGLLTDFARRGGIAGYPGDGNQHWPAVHALDVAVLFRLVLEGAPSGSAWHAVADEGDTVRDITEVVGRRLGLAVQQVSMEAFGPLGAVFAADQPSSSAYTRATLGWEPKHPSLLSDLENIQP